MLLETYFNLLLKKLKIILPIFFRVTEEFKCENCHLCDTLNSNNYGTDCEENCGLCPLCFFYNLDSDTVEGCRWCKQSPGDKYGVETCKKLCFKGEEMCGSTGPCQTQCQPTRQTQFFFGK